MVVVDGWARTHDDSAPARRLIDLVHPAVGRFCLCYYTYHFLAVPRGVAAHSGARERARARATVVIIAACTSDAIDLSGLDDDDDPRDCVRERRHGFVQSWSGRPGRAGDLTSRPAADRSSARAVVE